MYTSISSGGTGWTDLNIPSLIPGLAIIPWHVAIVNDRGDELMFRNSTNQRILAQGAGTCVKSGNAYRKLDGRKRENVCVICNITIVRWYAYLASSPFFLATLS